MVLYKKIVTKVTKTCGKSEIDKRMIGNGNLSNYHLGDISRYQHTLSNCRCSALPPASVLGKKHVLWIPGCVH